MSNSVVMTYGSYNFSPVPSLSYSRAAERTPGKDFCLSTPVTVELNGSIVTTGFQNVADAIQSLNDVFKCDNSCETFKVQCSTNTPWFNGPARVTNFSIQPRSDADIYANTASYNITLEMVSTTGHVYDNQPSGISAISEEWNIEFADERVGGTTNGIDSGTISLSSAYNVSHTVNITAPFACSGGDGLAIAKAYLLANFNSPDPNDAKASGIFAPSLYYFNHFRVINQNVYDGSVSLNETWIGTTDNSGVLEEFDANVNMGLDSNLATVSINGTIQGLATVNYPAATGTPKLSKAIDYWNNYVKSVLFSRATTVYDSSLFAGRSLNSIPMTKSYGYNTVAGTVTYNYEYNNRPANCVAAALAENITITENNPSDIFASLTILGRTSGPLYQEIGTVGPRTREIAIEAVLPINTGCSYAALSSPTDYDSLVATYEAGLNGDYDQVFVNSESKSWNPKEGRFTFNKSWTVGECS